MASLVDHIVEIRFMQEKLKEQIAAAKDDKSPDLIDAMTSRMLIKRYTDECAATFFSHLDEIIQFIPADVVAEAQTKFEAHLEDLAKETGPEVIAKAIMEAIFKTR